MKIFPKIETERLLLSELNAEATSRNFRLARKEATLQKFGNSEFLQKPHNNYNLDVVISVAYRVKSQQGTQFHSTP